MTTLVFGETGQLARALRARAPDAVFLGRQAADLGAPETCAAAIARHRPECVINAAAYTAVDRAEEETALAMQVNAAAPAAMASACARQGIPLLHVSSDYVFDGSGARPWQPGDPTAPLGAYGRSKLAGEDAVRRAGCVHVILRTSWVFSAHGSNFVKTMLRLGRSREQLNVVADQIGGPTPADAIAGALLRLQPALRREPGLGGTYHFAGAPDTSWADFARAIFERAGMSVAVHDIATADYPTPARRPANSRLDCSDLTARFGIQRPDWREGLDAVLASLKEAEA